MFLESVTVSGFKGVEAPKTAKFKFQDDVNISSINSTFLEAFSIIFDPKYNAEYDFTEFINDQYEGQHFVKAVLWQSNENTLTEISWLKKTRLTIERDLQNRHQVILNEKVLSVNAFHEAIANFGYITISGFHLHRLTKSEINQISFFSGEDLWNLITCLFNSKELVQVIDYKQTKKCIYGDEILRQMEQLENVLPNRLKTRDQIQHHFTLEKRFNTLLKINNERRLAFLNEQRDIINTDHMQLTDDFNKKKQNIEKIKRKEEQDKSERETLENQLKLMKQEVYIDIPLLEGQHIKDSSTFFSLLQETMTTIHTVAVQKLDLLVQQFKIVDELQEKLSNASAKLNAFDWRISLKEVKECDKEKYETRMRLLTRLIETEREGAQNILEKIEKANKEIEICQTKSRELTFRDLEEIKIEMKLHHQSQLSIVENILAMHKEILKSMKSAQELKQDIDNVQILGGLDRSFIKTLLDIESFVMMNHKLSVDYYGPVFQYLDDHPHLSKLNWTHFSHVVIIFLFSRGSTAREANRLLVGSKKIFGSYIFLGIDEFVPSPTANIPEELTEDIESVENLVRSDCAFRKTIQTLLREALLKWKIGRNRYCLSTENASSSIQTYSYIEHLQNVYRNVKDYAVLQIHIEKNQSLKRQLVKVLDEKKIELQSLREKAVPAFSNDAVAKLIKLLQLNAMQKKIYIKRSSTYENLKKLKYDIGNVDLWDLEELTNLRKTAAQEHYHISKEVETEEQEKQVELTNLIDTIVSKMKLMSGCIGNFSFYDIDGLQNDLIEIITQHRESCETDIQKIREGLLKPLPPIEIKTMLQIDLTELNCLLYEKNSKLSVIDSAIDLCNVHGNIDESLYQEKRQENIRDELVESYQLLENNEFSKRFKLMSNKNYVHLVESIRNLNKFKEIPKKVFSRNKVATNSFPLLNKFSVKVLKDAVYNYRTSFAQVMEDYATHSTLFFYTREVFDELREDQFSWNTFDLERLKALDFHVKWKRDSRENVSLTSLSKVKSLLLIAHIINYLSIFKFIIIDETLYHDMDEKLGNKLRTFLEIISPYVQIILHSMEVNEMELEENLTEDN